MTWLTRKMSTENSGFQKLDFRKIDYPNSLLQKFHFSNNLIIEQSIPGKRRFLKKVDSSKKSISPKS